MSQDCSNLFQMTQRLEAQGQKTLDSPFVWDDGSDHDDVTKIHVRGDSRGINCIRFDYIKSGQRKYKSFYGPSWAGFTQTFKINHKEDEQLESVEGFYKPDSRTIVGLQFKTNLRISELIGHGKKDDTKFSLAVYGKKIIGFHGCSGSYLESLGAYFTCIAPTRMEAKGAKGGTDWNDGADHEGVAKIYVRGGRDCIQYIKFDYVKDRKYIYGPAHGVRGRGFTESFEINHLDNEYMVSVEGYYDEGDSGIIQGIQFRTNIKTSELIGYNNGKKFSLAANGKKIIGFHGYADQNLNSLGAYFTTSPFIKLESRESTGDLWDDGTFEGVRKVCIHKQPVLYSVIQFEFVNRGEVVNRDLGLRVFIAEEGEFVVNYPYEFITSVEGTFTNEEDPHVASLTFKTSKGRTSSTFGTPGTKKFVLQSKGCGVVGFHGVLSIDDLSGLGAYFRLLPPLPDGEKVEAKGGDGGAPWDGGGFDCIRKIYIGHSEMGIAFVKFLYDKDNKVVVGDDHGSKTLLGVDEFELEHPDEYLISVEGSYDVVVGSESEVIIMLRFKTNMRTSQLFGLDTTSSFILQKECHKIVGFHGKIGKMLHQIGVHVLPITD
ncbi:Jacalin-like lectin domain [Arabidopsis suecica]|uniref:Jacalin-like lectin domain n=1 Tax=Arabidopsis suecica TaxID=45249 RepID=A0A8T2HEZ5_ARASU|nr:Jacalin-like lectin domain [Arabidopsis suecica]